MALEGVAPDRIYERHRSYASIGHKLEYNIGTRQSSQKVRHQAIKDRLVGSVQRLSGESKEPSKGKSSVIISLS